MNVQQLMEAVSRLDSFDALQCRLSLQEWQALAPYLAMRFLRVGEPLVSEGDNDREVFLLAEGEVEVAVQGHVIATLGAGNVVGEASFFSGLPRMATVIPSRPGVAFGLHWDKFDPLSQKHPALAMHLLRALATVLAIRMRSAVLVEHYA